MPASGPGVLEQLKERIQSMTMPARLPDGRQVASLPFYLGQELARGLARSKVGQQGHPRGRAVAAVERAALDMGVWPERYLRNFESYSLAEQLLLLDAEVAQVGLGGLGGHVLELMARAGVGTIRAADGDEFEPTNLNRQLYATRRSLGGYKAAAAAARLKVVNPAVAFEPVASFLDEAGMDGLVKGAKLCVDALGGLGQRAELARAAARAGVTMVTAAVAGTSGYVATVLPGASAPAEFLGQGAGAEASLGTPAPAVATAASLMTAEALNILCGRGPALAGKLLAFDLSRMSFETLSL